MSAWLWAAAAVLAGLVVWRRSVRRRPRPDYDGATGDLEELVTRTASCAVVLAVVVIAAAVVVVWVLV